MLQKISQKISDFFIKKQLIDKEEREVYDYSFEILLATFINLIAIIVISIITRTLIESILFTIAFMLMRGAAGGYHFNTHIGCFINLMIVYIGMILCIKLVQVKILFYISIAFIICSIVIILAFAPIDSKNKPLDSDEKKRLRKRSYIRISLLSIPMIVLLIFKKTIVYSFALSYAVFNVGISLIIGKIINKIIIHHDKDLPNFIEYNE